MNWKEGDPKSAGVSGWVWIANEDGDYQPVEVDADGDFYKPRGFGEVVAWAGPIEEPDESP